jgi:acid phosphatase
LRIFQTAQKLGVTVFFLTGRTADQQEATAKNLQAAGYAGYRRMFCKPVGDPRSTSAFKLAARQRLEAEGWTIIANVGDQKGDLTGGAAEKTFKLPDPFYLIE